jgi:hypothetical protein
MDPIDPREWRAGQKRRRPPPPQLSEGEAEALWRAEHAHRRAEQQAANARLEAELAEQRARREAEVDRLYADFEAGSLWLDSFVDTPQGIFTLAPDGSDRRLLIGHARQPAFSPDGSKLAYVAYRPWQFDGLFVAEADGSSPRALVPQSGPLTWGTPAWSPDDRRLAFTQNTLLNGRVVQTDLIVLGVDGSGERVLATAALPAGLSAPVWSPGGKFVAFVRYPSGAIVVARADGGGQRVVVARSNSYAPAWRPAVALPAAKRHPCPRL